MLRVFLKTHGLKLSTNPLTHSKPKKKNHLFWIPSLISQLSYIIFSPINSLRILFIPIPHTTIKKKKNIYIVKHPISPSLSLSNMDHEEIPSMPSTPATTPGTPGAPLFGGFEGKRNGHNGKYTPKSILKSCKCFNVDNEWALEDGRLPPVSCALPPPNVSLYRKVHVHTN